MTETEITVADAGYEVTVRKGEHGETVEVGTVLDADSEHEAIARAKEVPGVVDVEDVVAFDIAADGRRVY